MRRQYDILFDLELAIVQKSSPTGYSNCNYTHHHDHNILFLSFLFGLNELDLCFLNHDFKLSVSRQYDKILNYFYV